MRLRLNDLVRVNDAGQPPETRGKYGIVKSDARYSFTALQRGEAYLVQLWHDGDPALTEAASLEPDETEPSLVWLFRADEVEKVNP